ncbi:MAG: enoyl-CoA hydratase/isomerase family protein, partial [Anaerolineaceae bacterium]
MTDEQTLVIEEQRGGVLLLTLNRPERHHALNQALGEALSSALERAEANSDVAVVILTGSGTKAFCAGADMLEASGVTAGGGRVAGAALAINRVSTMPMPVIA